MFGHPGPQLHNKLIWLTSKHGATLAFGHVSGDLMKVGPLSFPSVLYVYIMCFNPHCVPVDLSLSLSAPLWLAESMIK